MPASQSSRRDPGLLTRRVELLEHVGRLGSIQAAAKAVGLSYRGAWAAVEQMNNAADEPLVERTAGGKEGGGTRLTPAGKRFVEAAQRAQEHHKDFVKGLPPAERELSRAWGWLRRLSLKTSARNQFFGRVKRLKKGAVNGEVELALPGGDQRIVATVTNDSIDELGLKTGDEAVALIKASWVLLAAGESEPRVSARNRLRGVIERIVPGPVSSEVVLRLGGGRLLTAVVTKESAEVLGLEVGGKAWALFKASSVIVGVWQ